MWGTRAIRPRKTAPCHRSAGHYTSRPAWAMQPCRDNGDISNPLLELPETILAYVIFRVLPNTLGFSAVHHDDPEIRVYQRNTEPDVFDQRLISFLALRSFSSRSAPSNASTPFRPEIP
jgi:hypothetical protein